MKNNRANSVQLKIIVNLFSAAYIADMIASGPSYDGSVELDCSAVAFGAAIVDQFNLCPLITQNLFVCLAQAHGVKLVGMDDEISNMYSKLAAGQ